MSFYDANHICIMAFNWL